MEIFYIRCLLFLLLLNLSGLTRGVKQWAPDNDWPRFTAFGQISAVAVDVKGDVYVFHRGDREWGQHTFDAQERYADLSDGPIKTMTIVLLNSDGNLKTSSGKNLFYMPHGLTVDDENNVWVTDVGLHQVMKFPPLGNSKNETLPKALLTLGQALTPGRGHNSFCKPTSVAVDSVTKDFFVADGYCNSRILKYDRHGNMILQWGRPAMAYNYLGPYNLRVPHSLALDESRQQLLVADRENSRVLSYTTDGKFLHQINTRGHVYGISYSHVTDLLYAVTGGSYTQEASGLVFSMKNGNLTSTFAPDQNFQNAHDVAVSGDGQHVYVIELNPFLAWRFTVAEPTPASAEVKPIPKTEAKTGPPTSSKSVTPLESEESNLGANQIAVSVVTVVVLLGIVAVSCHLYRKKNRTSAMEMRGLILDDDEDRIF